MLSESEIQALPRSEVRYAMFRQRAGNPDAEHDKILDWYRPKIAEYGLTWDGFSDIWDISPKNNLDIISGHNVYLIKQANKTLFNKDGSLKEE